MSVKKDFEAVNTKLGLIEAAIAGLTKLFKSSKPADEEEEDTTETEDEAKDTEENPDEDPETEENPENESEDDGPEDVKAITARADKALATVEQLAKDFKAAKSNLDSEAGKKANKAAAKKLAATTQKPFAGSDTPGGKADKFAKLHGRAKLVAAVREKINTK